MYIGTGTSFPFPKAIFRNGYAIKPNAMPSTMLYVSGIITIIKKAGNPSEKSCREMFCMDVIIRPPIMIRTGAIAESGMILKIGIKNSDVKNNNPVVIAVRPVRPPAEIPEALSTVETVGLVPKRPDDMAEIAFA